MAMGPASTPGNKLNAAFSLWNSYRRFWLFINNFIVHNSLIVHENLAFFNGLYEKPWARISPYIVGICVGYVLHRISGKIEISLIVMGCGMFMVYFFQILSNWLFEFCSKCHPRIWFLVGWIACSFLMIALVLSKLSGTSSSSSVTFSTMSYAMWSLIVLWLIIASISKHRGLDRFMLLLVVGQCSNWICCIEWNLEF